MRQVTSRSSSSPDTGPQPRIVLSVALGSHSTYTDVLLTFDQAALRWIKRLIVAQLALDTAALVGSSMWTFVQAHL